MSQKQNITALVFDKRGKLLSMGRNSYVKTHPMQARLAKEVGEEHKIFLHAEVDALVKLRDWDRAHKLVITRYTRDGEPALCVIGSSRWPVSRKSSIPKFDNKWALVYNTLIH